MQVNISGAFTSTPKSVASGDTCELALPLEADTAPSVDATLEYHLESSVHTFQETGTNRLSRLETIPQTGKTVTCEVHIVGPPASNAKVRVTVTPSGTPPQSSVTGVTIKGFFHKLKEFFGIGALLLLPAVAGCHDPNNFTLTAPNAANVLSLTLDGDVRVLPADGTTRTRVTARVHEATDRANLELTFTTTAGTLISGAKQGSPVTAKVDSSGEAIVELKSAASPGTATVEVSVAGVTRRVIVEFEQVPVAQLFTVALSAGTLPADGYSVSRIGVQLRRSGLSADERQIVIETSAGTLLGAATGQRATLTADSTGAASVDLQSATTPGTSNVTVTWLGAVQKFDVPFTPADPLNTIRLTASRQHAPADGATPITLTAAIASALPAGRRTVVFRADWGAFAGAPTATMTADRGNDVSANLTATQANSAQVTATVDGTSVQTTVFFTRAFPDSLAISADTGHIPSGGSTNLRVQVRRDTGMPSLGLIFTYSAVTSSGAPIGSFSRVGTNTAAGEATATFELGTTAYTGPVTIRVTAEGGAAASTQIVVQ